MIRAGSDTSLVARGAQLSLSRQVAKLAEKEGLSCEGIGLRPSPLG